jgi:acyl CoA:acetate/3-ketoacid CoA transferase alpha subunit
VSARSSRTARQVAFDGVYTWSSAHRADLDFRAHRADEKGNLSTSVPPAQLLMAFAGDFVVAEVDEIVAVG